MTKPISYYRDQYGTHPIFEDSDLAAHIALTNPHSAVSAATADRLVLRDAAGRAQVVAPSAAADIARKDTVDNLAGTGRTTETVKANADAIALRALASRQIIAGVGLSGGGDLTADRTLTVAIPTLYIEDQKASGTNGGPSVSGAWYKRTLNTVQTNTISGASLSSDQITLPAGTYWIEANAPAYWSNGHKIKLYNVSDSADVLIGSTESSYQTMNRSFLHGAFTITASKTFEIRYRCEASKSPEGLGYPCSLGVIEVYTQVEIRKTA